MIVAAVTNFIIHVISAGGYAGVAALMAIQSAAIPLPSEIIMPFAGFLASQGRFSLPLLALVGALGNVAGGSAIYWLGRYGGRPLVERYGRFVLISRHDLDLADRFFARFGLFSIFVGRMLPVVNTFISLPAGISRARFAPFVVYTFFGSLIWSFALAYFGSRLGPQWLELRQRVHGLDYVVAVLVVIGGVWWVYRHFRRKPA